MENIKYTIMSVYHTDTRKHIKACVDKGGGGGGHINKAIIKNF